MNRQAENLGISDVNVLLTYRIEIIEIRNKTNSDSGIPFLFCASNNNICSKNINLDPILKHGTSSQKEDYEASNGQMDSNDMSCKRG